MKPTSQKVLDTFLSSAPRMHVDLAPKALQTALANAEKARLATNTAEALHELAPVEVQQAKAAWDVVAEQAVRAGNSLPSKELIERAGIGIDIAASNLATVNTLRTAFEQDVAATLAADAIRTEWNTALKLRASTIQTRIRKISDELLPLYTELNQSLAAAAWLNTYPNAGPPVGPLFGNLSTILADAINIKSNH